MNSVYAEQYKVFTALTIGTTNVSPLTAYSGYTLAFMTFEGSAIRYRIDGVSAASGSGHLVSAGVSVNLNGADTVVGFNAICTNTTGTVMVSIGGR